METIASPLEVTFDGCEYEDVETIASPLEVTFDGCKYEDVETIASPLEITFDGCEYEDVASPLEVTFDKLSSPRVEDIAKITNKSTETRSILIVVVTGNIIIISLKRFSTHVGRSTGAMS